MSRAPTAFDAHHPSVESPNIPTTPSPSNYVIVFMDLPGEIRNRIYEHVVEDILNGPDEILQLFGDETEQAGRAKLEDGVERVDFMDIRPCHFQRSASCFQISDPNTLKSGLNLYRLGQISRAVRREFFSMLFVDVQFRICPCALQVLAHGRPEARAFQLDPPLSILRGNLRTLVVGTEGHDHRYNPRVAWLLGKVLPTLQFKGQLTTTGNRMHLELFPDAMKLVTAAFRAGKEDKKANDEARTLYLDSHWLSFMSRGKSEIMSITLSVDFSARI